MVVIIFLLILLKWGVPFLFEKVLIPLMQWEATTFGRPVLALVLVASLAFFSCVLNSFWPFHVVGWNDFWIWHWVRYNHGWNNHWDDPSLFNWTIVP